MDFSPFLGFAGISLALVMTPGADWAYTISAGLRRSSPVPSVAGLCTGYVLHTALVTAGLGVLLAARPDLVSWLSIAGAFYLAWLGLTTLRSWRSARIESTGSASSGDLPTLDQNAGTVPLLAVAERPRRGREFLVGLGTSGINPKGVLLFAAVMPQFVTLSSPLPVAAQTTVMGLSHVLICVLVYGAVAFAARRLLRSRPGLARTVTLGSGLLMLLISVALLVEQGGHLLA